MHKLTGDGAYGVAVIMEINLSSLLLVEQYQDGEKEGEEREKKEANR